MAAIQGQPAPKPSSVMSPVPGEAVAGQELKQALDVKLPQVSAAPSAPQAGISVDEALSQLSVDDALAQLDQGGTPASQGQDFPVAPSSSFAGINMDLKQQIDDIPTRIQASLAGDPKSIKLTLENKFGPENVRMKGNELFFRKPGEKDFHSLSPKGFEIINDLFSDNYRTAIATLGGVGGAAAGMSAGPAGAAVGGVLGYAAGTQAADTLGQSQYGVVKDPSIMDQKVAAENSLRPQGEFTPSWLKSPPAGSVGEEMQKARIAFQDKITEGIEFEALNKFFGAALGKIGDTIASRRLAAEAAKKPSLTTQEITKIADGVAEAAQSLSDSGIQLKQGKIVLSPGQIAGNLSPEAQSLDASLSKDPKVRDFFMEQGKLVANGWDKLQQSLSNVAGKTSEELFQSVKGASKAAREVEGKTIGTFREQAIKLSNGEPMPMLQTHDMINPFYGELGFSRSADGKLLKPDLGHLQEMFPDASPAVLGKLSNLVGDLETQLRKGQGNMPMTETNRIYSAFRDTIDNWWGSQSGGDVARYLVPIKNALRNDFADQAGSVLGKARPEALPDYQLAMKRYSDVMNAQETLKNVLKKKDVSSAAFADQIFSPAQGKDKIAQLKVLINDTDSTLWPQLVDQQLSLMKGRATDNAGRTDWAKLSGQIAKLDDYGILDQMMKPGDKVLMKDFFTVARNVDGNFKFSASEPVSSGVVNSVKGMIQKAIALKNGKDVASDIIAGIGKDQALVKWLDGEGLSLVLKDLPKSQQPAASGMIQKAISAARANMANQAKSAIDQIPESIRQPGVIPAGMAVPYLPQFGSMPQQINDVRKGTPVGQ